MNDIDLDDFLAILDGAVDEGDNGTFYVDEAGVRSTMAPTVKERAELNIIAERFRGRDENKNLTDHLEPSEADVLREFANECRFDFPITLDTAMAWAANIISMDPSEVKAKYIKRKGEPPERAKSEPIAEVLSPGHPAENTEAINDALEIESEQKRQGKKPNRMEACREAVKKRFPNHHDPESKAKSIAAGIRARRQK